jgi:protein-S-isoprenylcysteine O-methyltransferase Ste14
METNRSALMKIPPPIAFVLTFVLGAALERLVGWPLRESASSILRIVGIAFTAIGASFSASSIAFFVRAKTTIVPHAAASSLVTHGAYRFTRNPMYVGLTLVYLGVAGILGWPWPIVVVAIPLLWLNAVVIPFEENRLRAIFGASYERYCLQVRRWL